MSSSAKAARPAKKDDDKAKETVSVQHVSVEEFARTRDALVTGLATIQSAIQDLSRAYIAHSNALLGRGSNAQIDYLALSNPFGNGGFNIGNLPHAGANHEDAKKKEKKPVDPNAPKKPLTAYFLYLQSARPVISKDLGESATPTEIAAEALRRWREMSDKAKAAWKHIYQKNREEYSKRYEAYKAHLAGDPVAAQLVTENGDTASSDAEPDDDALAEVEEQLRPAAESTPPPSQKTSKRRRGNAPVRDHSDTEGSPAPLPTVKRTPVYPPGMEDDEGPSQKEEKKRKRTDRKSKGEAEAREEADSAKPRKGETEREKRARKKRKSEAEVEL